MPRLLRRLLIGAIVAASMPVATAGATTYEVNLQADVGGPCPPTCSLRGAVGAVNAGAGGDVIKVPAGTYPLSLGVLSLEKDVTIEGAGVGATIVDANSTFRIFQIFDPAVDVRLVGMTIEEGVVTGTSSSPAMGGCIVNVGALTMERVVVRKCAVKPANNTGTSPRGGGIFNAGSLTLLNGTIEANEASSLPHPGGVPSGAGLHNDGGDVRITDSALLENVSRGGAGSIPAGGGFYSIAPAAHGASVELTRVRVEGNDALIEGAGGIPDGGGSWALFTDLTIRESAIVGNTAIGGGISNSGGLDVLRGGTFTMERSLVADNVTEAESFGNGGGLRLSGDPGEASKRIVNSTIVGNRASASGTTGSGGGGGVQYLGDAPLEILSSTVSGNEATGGSTSEGGNIEAFGSGGGSVAIRDTIVAAGVASFANGNCSGTVIVSAGHNLESLDQCGFHAAGDKVNVDPLLAPLAANGGPTATMALLPGSPAIDAGAGCPPTDQRGVARPQGPGCDIGAFEDEVFPPIAPPTTGVAKLRLLKREVTVGRKSGKGRLRAECLNVAVDLCRVELRLQVPKPKAGAGASAKRRQIGVGTVKGAIAGGKRGPLRVKLNAKGRMLLAASPRLKVRVTVRGASRNRAGEPTAIGGKLTVKSKRPPRR